MIPSFSPAVGLCRSFSKRTGVWGLGLVFFAGPTVHADPEIVKLGFDYALSAVGIGNNDGVPTTQDDLNYYSHQIRAYLNGWVSPSVEAGLRVQSVNVWGLEASTNAPATRYPAADGSVEKAASNSARRYSPRSFSRKALPASSLASIRAPCIFSKTVFSSA